MFAVYFYDKYFDSQLRCELLFILCICFIFRMWEISMVFFFCLARTRGKCYELRAKIDANLLLNTRAIDLMVFRL